MSLIVNGRRRTRWEQLDVNTAPARTPVLCTTTRETGEFYGLGADGRAHVHFDGDKPWVVDTTIDPATLLVETR